MTYAHPSGQPPTVGLLDLIADGTLSARVDSTVPLDDFKKVFALARSGGREGKIHFTCG